MDKRELFAILHDIDEEVLLSFGEPKNRSCVVIVGGSALMLRDLTQRLVTHDVDVLLADSRVREIMNAYPAVNGAVAAHADEIPYNFEDRLVEIEADTRAVRFTTPSLEDLAVMKLYAWRPNDIEDLTSTAFLHKLDWDVLDHLVHDKGEAQASALSERRYREMVHIYEEYRKEWRPCD